MLVRRVLERPHGPHLDARELGPLRGTQCLRGRLQLGWAGGGTGEGRSAGGGTTGAASAGAGPAGAGPEVDAQALRARAPARSVRIVPARGMDRMNVLLFCFGFGGRPVPCGRRRLEATRF